MAKKAKKIKTGKGLKLSVVNPSAAGIDVSSSEMQVCVPEDRDSDNNRRFGVFTEDLEFISDWLKACRIDTVAMESTGVYWIPLFMTLVSHGFDVLLVNAKAVKNIGEKKTDEVDAEWIMLLHSYGLLKASFQPNNEARRIRNLSRHRNNLIKTSSREVLHMQKSMELMNIKLGNVISDILGKSGQGIIQAILAGERDASKLAQLADLRCKSSKEEIAKSLNAKWDDDLLFMLKQSYELYLYIQQQIKACDMEMESVLKKYQKEVGGGQPFKECLRSKKKKNLKNGLSMDIEWYADQLWGVNLMRIPGISDTTLSSLLGELGHDFTDKFDSSKQFCRWCNLTPNNKISGGKLLSSKVPKRKNPVGQILRNAANSLRTSKSPLGEYFRHQQFRKGYIPAIIATANKMAKMIYIMLKNKTEYDEALIKSDSEQTLKKKLIRTQKTLEKIKEQLKETA